MAAENLQEMLRRIPPMTELLQSDEVSAWLQVHPLPLVTDCLRASTGRVRSRVLGGNGPVADGLAREILSGAAELLSAATVPHLHAAINATGIILHTGLGRAVFAEAVVNSIVPELKGYSTLAVDPATGERVERDELVEYILTELTGAEAATVVNNNAAATMLVLAALAAHREVIVSRGQLIEIGGSFRLPEVMAQSQAKLVEVGATNRTHLRDYKQAVTPETAALMRVHPSNYRVVGFTSEPGLQELAELTHKSGLIMIDDLGAGALLDLEQFGLPHEPTVRESIQAGADVAMFSGDKLIGAGQCGIIVGRKNLIQRLRKHPLMRAVRVDKTCLMVLERTLHLFRRPELLRDVHPTYRMVCTPVAELHTRATRLTEELSRAVPAAKLGIDESTAYLGSGSLPTQAIPSVTVSVAVPDFGATELARRLRMDLAAVFGRIEADVVRLDMRTITEDQVPQIAAALKRVLASATSAAQ